MSTRSNIGILQKNGNIRSIYCHWDGYPEYNGVLLKNFYNNSQKILRIFSDCGVFFFSNYPQCAKLQ